MTGFINLIIIAGIVPIVKMSHQITKISTKIEMLEEVIIFYKRKDEK